MPSLVKLMIWPWIGDILLTCTNIQLLTKTYDAIWWHLSVSTHWGRDKMAANFQTTFANRFSWMKMYEFLSKFHWSFVPRGPIKNIPTLVQIMGWHQPGDKPLSEPMMVNLLMHICITRLQWVNMIKRHERLFYRYHTTILFSYFLCLPFI